MTAVPGTTTDRVEGVAVFEGITFRLNDSCGLTDVPAGVIEAEGDRRSREFASRADILLWMEDAVLPGANGLPPNLGDPRSTIIVVYNKIDLPDASAPPGALAISALTGENVDSLVEKLLEVVPAFDPVSTVSLAERERAALLAAADHAGIAITHLNAGTFLDLVAEEIRAGSRAVGALLGDITPEEVLTEIFANFCVGK